MRHHVPDPQAPVPEDAAREVISVSGEDYATARDEALSRVPTGWQALFIDVDRD